MTHVLADISFGPVWDQRSLLLGGIWLMLRVAVASMIIAVAGGLLLARLRLSRLRWVSVLAFVLIQVLRGVALYVLVLWLFNGLAVASGITLSAVQTGIIALSLLNSAYLAEVFRAGFEAIPAGQGEAAQAIGLSDRQAARFVLVPQMVRITFPSMGNVFVDIVKDTAILSVIGVSELMRETQRWAQFYFRSFEFYTAAGLIYLAIVRGGQRRLASRGTAPARPPRRRHDRPAAPLALDDADRRRRPGRRRERVPGASPAAPPSSPVGRAGIGAAIVERLVAEGAAVVVADRLGDAAESLAAAQRAAGNEVIAHEVDLTDLGAIAAMVDAAIAWRGDLDILVNNAGVDLPGSVLEATVDEWDVQLAVNLRAPFFAIQAAAQHMVARGSGKIVNTVSTSGFASSSTPNTIYDLTKGGLRQLTISAAVELAPLGVNVNGVAPGTVATELTTAVLDTPEKLARATARIPRGTFGRPADIAAAVAFLSSDDADYIHGHVLVVDGGWLAI